MNYTNEAWEEEQMSNLGCESVADLIAEVKRLKKAYKNLVLVADELYLHIVGEPHMTLDELVAEMSWREEE